MPIVSSNAHSFHPCSSVASDALTNRHFHLYFIQLSLNTSVKHIYRGFSELVPEKGPGAEIPLLQQSPCCNQLKLQACFSD